MFSCRWRRLKCRAGALKNQLILLQFLCVRNSHMIRADRWPNACHRSIRCAPSRRPPGMASLTKAAGELNVTHGAISHQIKALEQSLNVKLFERAGQRLKLTPHGAELLPAVSTPFDGIAAATARMTRPSSSGALSVSCVPALLSLWVIPRLGSFTAQYPEIRLTLNGSNDPQESSRSSRCLRALWRRQLDRLLAEEVVDARALPGCQPDADQQPADPHRARSCRSCHPACRRRARMAQLAGCRRRARSRIRRGGIT